MSACAHRRHAEALGMMHMSIAVLRRPSSVHSLPGRREQRTDFLTHREGCHCMQAGKDRGQAL